MAQSAGRGRLRRLVALCCPTRFALIVCFLVCVVAPVSLVAVHIHQNPLFSPVDEAEHFDYVQRIAEGSLPRIGQNLLPSTDRLLACTGRAAPGWAPSCGSSAVRSEIDSDNNQYEAQQPPLYYAVTAVMRWPFIHILGLGALSGTRFTGALWLAAGLLLIWLAGCLVGLDWWVVGAGALLLCVAPDVVYSSSMVTNDAASVFAGGVAAVLGAVGWTRWRYLPTWLYALCGFLVAMLKGSDALGVITVSAVLAAGAYAESRASGGLKSGAGRRRWLSAWLPAGGALLLGSLVGVAAWSVTFQALALVTPRELPAFVTMGAGRGKPGLSELAGNALAMLNPLAGGGSVGNQYRSSFRSVQPGSAFATNMAQLTSALCWYLTIAAGFAILFVRERRWAHWLGVISLLVLFFGGWALGISIYKTYGYDTVLPGRYGLSVAPLLILALVGAFEGRWPTRLLWTFSIATFALSFLYMFG